MDREDMISCPAMLALEMAPGAQPARSHLDREQADALAELVAQDLRALMPEVEQARLALIGAHFDPVELLRPGFPLFTALDELALRLPHHAGEHGVAAFGSHDGRMPTQTLTPDPALAGGALRLMPWTLIASGATGRHLGEQMEVELVGRGEAGARTADFLMRALDVRLEHARYLTRHDLMALICVQYEHVNLASLWQLLEAGLLTPHRGESAATPHGLAMEYRDGRVLLQPPSAWLDARRDDADDATRAHDYAAAIFELRQHAALLAAHGLPVSLSGTGTEAGSRYLLDVLDGTDADGPPPELFLHQAPGLGTVTISVAQRNGARVRLLAHAYPMTGGIDAQCAELAARFGARQPAQALGHVHVEDGRLTVPAAQRLH